MNPLTCNQYLRSRFSLAMKIKSFLAKPFASYIYAKIRKGTGTALQDQDAILKELLKVGKTTEFGKEHHFDGISTYDEFKKAVPVRDYEAFKPYINRIKEGKHNVLWKGMPIYFAKTSGTTSGVKYIPISKESIPTISIRPGTPCFAIWLKRVIPLLPTGN
jgi:hypothetical protein